jgi:alpha-L-fucosidase
MACLNPAWGASTCLLTLLLPGVPMQSAAAQHGREAYVEETDSLVRQKLAQWQDAKFGLMMHWGPYSQWGIVESWSLCAEDEPWCARKMEDYTEYVEAYEKLQTTFDPVEFDPAKWARAAKQAGMKYVVFTTKHHDGFSMFDTKYTDYRITHSATPFSKRPRADVTREIFDAFRNEGFMIGAYFSKPDWHSPYYWWPRFATPDRNANYDIAKHPERWQKFVEFTHNQIDELVTGYGRVDILWLDGGWVRPLTREEILRRITSPDYKFARVQSQDIDMPRLVTNARKKQPGLIVVDRAVPGPYQNYLTPEARVPDEVLAYPWETCMPMATSWSYVPNDRYKSPRALVHMLVDVVSKGGNLLLNVGPDGKGRFDPDAYDRLEKVGKWMSVNGEAIYGTRPIAPHKEGKIRLTQGKDGAVYATYLADEGEDHVPERLSIMALKPGDNATISMLGAPGTLRWKPAETGFTVEIPSRIRNGPPSGYAWVLKISPSAVGSTP